MSKAFVSGLMTLTIFGMIIAAGLLAGASAGEANNETAYHNGTAELDKMDERVAANASDSGLSGAMHKYMVQPLVRTSEQIAISSVKFGYQYPTIGKYGSYGLTAGIWGYLLYYTYSLIQTARRHAQ